MLQTLVSTKYQVVIPKSVRKKVKIHPGQKININLIGDQIILSPTDTKVKLDWPDDHIKKLKNPWRRTSAEKYLEKERNSWE